jgi:outer membrane protein assembly factor BamB
MMSSLSCYLALILMLSALTVSANWPQFRGPDGQSIAEGQILPENFGPDQNVLWKTELPAGHSSPCILGDRIFLTGFDQEAMQLIMISLRRSDGKILWTKTRPLRALQRYAHDDSSPSVPTPCTDGKRVAFLFGDYGLIVTDFTGKEMTMISAMALHP